MLEIADLSLFHKWQNSVFFFLNEIGEHFQLKEKGENSKDVKTLCQHFQSVVSEVSLEIFSNCNTF